MFRKPGVNLKKYFYGEFESDYDKELKEEINPVIPVFEHIPELNFRDWVGVKGYSWDRHPILTSGVNPDRRACVFAFEMIAAKEKQTAFSEIHFSYLPKDNGGNPHDDLYAIDLVFSSLDQLNAFILNKCPKDKVVYHGNIKNVDKKQAIFKLPYSSDAELTRDVVRAICQEAGNASCEYMLAELSKKIPLTSHLITDLRSAQERELCMTTATSPVLSCKK